MQQGEYVADLIRRRLDGKSTEPFRYFDKGSMATIGRAAAVAEFGRLHFSGFIAWLAWLFVHLMFLVGFGNRVLVFLQWMWNYFSYRRGVRLIVSPPASETVPESGATRAIGAILLVLSEIVLGTKRSPVGHEQHSCPTGRLAWQC